jgi:hypothetical protein
MSDPTPDPTKTTTTDVKPPSEFSVLGTLSHAAEVVGHGVADALHYVGGAIEGVLPAAEDEAKKVIAAELPAAAKFALDYLERNKAEYGDKVAAAVVAFLLSRVPGLSLAAPEITPLVVTEFDAMVAVLETELKTLSGGTKS